MQESTQCSFSDMLPYQPSPKTHRGSRELMRSFCSGGTWIPSASQIITLLTEGLQCVFSIMSQSPASEGVCPAQSGHSLCMFSFASVGTTDGRILLSSANLLALSLAEWKWAEVEIDTAILCSPGICCQQAVTHTCKRLFEVGLYMFPQQQSSQ